MKGVPVKEIQHDEVWGYVRKKDRNLTPQDGTDVGSQYVFVAMEAKTKLVPSVIGKRAALLLSLAASLALGPASASLAHSKNRKKNIPYRSVHKTHRGR